MTPSAVNDNKCFVSNSLHHIIVTVGYETQLRQKPTLLEVQQIVGVAEEVVGAGDAVQEGEPPSGYADCFMEYEFGLGFPHRCYPKVTEGKERFAGIEVVDRDDL